MGRNNLPLVDNTEYLTLEIVLAWFHIYRWVKRHFRRKQQNGNTVNVDFDDVLMPECIYYCCTWSLQCYHKRNWNITVDCKLENL